MRVSTRTLPIDPDEPDTPTLDIAAEIIRGGGLVAFATETVYGLGADATNPDAVNRIYEAKGRPQINPLIVHVSNNTMARSCTATWPETATQLSNAFWPGPLTLVLPRSNLVPDLVTAGRDTVALRMPLPAVARGLIERAGRPLAAPSANRSSGVSPTLALHVLEDLDTLVDLILDSGLTTLGLESTVVDLTTREPRILRPGPLGPAELRHALGGLHVRYAEGDSAAVDSPLPSPGLLSLHYAPRVPLHRIDCPAHLETYSWPEKAALLVLGPHMDLPPIPREVLRFRLATPTVAARGLYATLRKCDTLHLERVVVLPPPDLTEWYTIRDRLLRATGPRPG